MAIDYSVLALPKGTPAALGRHRKRVVRDAALEKAYAAVDARDGRICQVTWKPLLAGHLNDRRALERNHLKPRSTAPAARHDPDNILTVSRFVHRLMQAAALYAVDERKRKTTSVRRIAGFEWNRRQVPAGKEPFRLAPVPVLQPAKKETV